MGGKRIRQCEKAQGISSAKLRLGDFAKSERSDLEAPAECAEGNAAFRDLVKF